MENCMIMIAEELTEVNQRKCKENVIAKYTPITRLDG